jgi:hypothetical protein
VSFHQLVRDFHSIRDQSPLEKALVNTTQTEVYGARNERKSISISGQNST